MKTESIQQLSFMIILHAGNARSSAFEALAAAKRSDEALVQAKLEEAETSFLEAHKLQTELLQEEARGTRNEQRDERPTCPCSRSPDDSDDGQGTGD